MGNRSTVFKFFVITLLMAVLGLQLLSMKQSDRLFDRIDRLDRRISATPSLGRAMSQSDTNEAKYGDWLINRIGAEPSTLNPITSRDYYASMICSGSGATGANIFQSLAAPNPDTGEYQPILAESWKIAEDGLQIEYTLKENIRFSDNTPITAEDVIFSFELIKNPLIDNAHLANYFEDVISCEKVGDRKIRFTMRQVYFKLLEITGSMSIVPKHIYNFEDPQEFNRKRTNPIGSGPYVFEKWEVGNYVSLVRNENYWGKKPFINRLVYKVISNDLAAISAMRANQLDLVGTNPEQYLRLSEDKSVLEDFKPLSYWLASGGYTYIGWNMETEFFSDRQVRRAMTMLIDRESIRDNIYKSMAKIVTGPFYHKGEQYNQNITPLPFDPVKAGELLDQAGWKDTTGDGFRDKDGKTFRFRFLMPSGNDTYEQIVKLLKDEFARAGIDLIPDTYEWSVFTQKLMSKEFDAITLGWTGSMESDPYQIWHSSQTEGGGSNRIGFKNARADEIIEQARRTLDKEERNALYHELHGILHNEQPYTFMFARPSLGFLSNRYENVTEYTLGLNYHEWFVEPQNRRYTD